MPYFMTSLFYFLFALLTSALTVKAGFKRPWVVTAACWLWPVTWIVAILLSPYFIHKDETEKKQ